MGRQWGRFDVFLRIKLRENSFGALPLKQLRAQFAESTVIRHSSAILDRQLVFKSGGAHQSSPTLIKVLSGAAVVPCRLVCRPEGTNS
eukprot:m.146530 g.146530  ORF g.146530 m.146530 type:complete len:88 (-) comp14148_c0_seq1:28-291(-)